MDKLPERRTQSASVFPFFTTASPSQVWSALTDPAQTRAYLYGQALSSEWTVDADITTDGSALGGSRGLSGRVLCLWPEQRLSYLLRSRGGPPVYLTWRVRPGPGGSVCSLRVDEPDGSDGAEGMGEALVEELEDIWLPVVDRLRRLLDSAA